MTRYYVNETTDPYSSMIRCSTIEDAKAMASTVGHFMVYEYEATPGIPGVEPESEEIAANIYYDGNSWVRDVVEVENYV